MASQANEQKLSPTRFISQSGKTLIFLCVILIGIRFLFTGIMGIMPQDAYYYFYASHLDLSYFDHPPMIAYLLWFFTFLFGKTVFALKLADTVITLLTVAAFYHLAGKFLSTRKSLMATMLLISTLMISILSLVSTPDVPLMLCWTLSLNFLYEALIKKRNIYWIWAGIMTGLSFDSKYTAVFLIIGLIGFLLVAKPYRKYLISKWLVYYCICFAMTILPVIIWNTRNGFASFKFQSEGRAKAGVVFNAIGLAGVIGHQAAILIPILFFSLLYFIYRFARKYKWKVSVIQSDQLFLLSFFLPLFLGFLSLSFIYWVKVNWMMPAYISGIIWVSRYWNSKWIRYQLIFSVIIHMALVCEVLFYIVPVKSDDVWYGWKEFSAKVETIRKEYPQAFIFSADDYKTSAVLNFYLPEMIYSKNVVGQQALQFDYIGTDLNQLNGRDAIFIDSNPWFDNLKNENAAIPASYYTYFDQIIPMDPILIEHRHRIVRKFSVFMCKNYHTHRP